jgi:hypothetical protein
MESIKYPKTSHFAWSEGVSNNDKIAASIDRLINSQIVITEKVDGGCSSLEFNGVFARTHTHSPTHQSFDWLKSLHSIIRHKIPENLQIFGENLWALHSIAYDTLPSYFLMFGIRQFKKEVVNWWSWNDIKTFAVEMGLETVPVLWKGVAASQSELQDITERLAQQPSAYGQTREGVVVRVAGEFADKDFSTSVVKWVRKNHVSTNTHWAHKEIIKNKLKI